MAEEPKDRVSGARQTGRAVVGSYPVKCAAGHEAVALVWSDGRVEMVCPACGRHEIPGSTGITLTRDK